MRQNVTNVLREAAAAYKVDTDAITLKVRQEFAAKEKARVAKKGVTKVQSEPVKKSKVA
jgi:ParB family chromosome partitioning protein